MFPGFRVFDVLRQPPGPVGWMRGYIFGFSVASRGSLGFIQTLVRCGVSLSLLVVILARSSSSLAENEGRHLQVHTPFIMVVVVDISPPI